MIIHNKLWNNKANYNTINIEMSQCHIFFSTTEKLNVTRLIFFCKLLCINAMRELMFKKQIIQRLKHNMRKTAALFIRLNSVCFPNPIQNSSAAESGQICSFFCCRNSFIFKYKNCVYIFYVTFFFHVTKCTLMLRHHVCFTHWAAFHCGHQPQPYK